MLKEMDSTNAGPDRPLDLKPGACVVPTFAIEYSDDGRGGGRFHGIARKEPERWGIPSRPVHSLEA